MAVISSPLAKSLQGGLIQRVSGGVFGGGRGITPLSSPAVSDDRSSSLLETNQQTLSNISSSLVAIQDQLSGVRQGIDNIGQRILAESQLEEASAKADQEYQRRLAERQVRASGEQELERKIQSALTEPVTRIQNKVSSVFGNVMNALGILFLGWLTNQGVEALRAAAEGNVKKLRQIGTEILKAFALLIGAGGALSLLKTGIFKIIGVIGGLAGRVGGFVISGLFIKPFKMVIDALKGAWSKVTGAGAAATRPGGGGGGKPGGGGFLSGIGKILTGLSGAMNFLNGENTDAALAALTFVPGGGIFKGIRAAAATIFTIDEIAEALGKNFSGADPKLLAQKKKELEEAKKAQKDKKEEQAQTTPVAQPQTPMMGGEKKEEKNKGVEPNPNSGARIPSASDSGVSVPSGMEGTVSPATPQTPMTPSAADLSLGSTATTPNITSTEGSQTPAITTPTETTPAAITPVSSQSADVKMESLGPESKPPTTVIAQIPSIQKPAKPPAPPGAGTNVPMIRSSNPDNFYALYSQFNYNVVT